MPNEGRFAACDIGSNALRLVVSQVTGKAPQFLQREASYRIPLRLGEDVFRNGSISEEKTTALTEACCAFRHLLRVFQPESFRACATSALREAENASIVVERVFRESRIRLEIMSGGEEAQTLLYNVSERRFASDKDYLYVDVGGGSTELTLFADGHVLCSASFRIGGVRLLHERVEGSEWERMKSWLEELPKGNRRIEAIGTGGNISKIYDLSSGVTGQVLRRHDIRDVVFALEPLSVEERIRAYGLKPDRADVIVEAGRVYDLVMEWANLETMVVPKLGLVDGLLSRMFHDKYGYFPVHNTGK